MRRHLGWVLLVVACSKSASRIPAPLDVLIHSPYDGVMAECTLTTFGGTPDGQCVAQWTCRSVGSRTLACGMLDAGVGCICTADDGTTSQIAMVPASCSDPAVLTAFATTACGWGGL